MRFFLSIFILIYTNICIADWTDLTFHEDKNFQYWVGLSTEFPTKKEALLEAYNDAIREAVQYNYGFTHSSNQNIYQTKKVNKLYVENSLSTNKIHLTDILPIKQKIEKTKTGFVAYRLIKYSKSAINKEKQRLKLQAPELKKTNFVIESNQKNFLSKLNIMIQPKTATITLYSNQDKTKIYYSKGNSTFLVPIGTYKMVIRNPGYKTISDDIILGANITQIKRNLAVEDGLLSFHGIKPNSHIFINNIEYSLNELKTKEFQTDKQLNITIKNKNYLTMSLITQTIPNDIKILEIKQTPRTHYFSIITEPSDATIYIDGKNMGKSPLYNIPQSTIYSKINIIKKGYKIINKTIDFTINKELSFLLKKL